ncbi:type I-G CRISPR-associated protein Cas8g1/Csx17 [Nocardia alni]|uniref:type I-G CRISPR-associated protein Cas8g1/Csx17 n=1 Tax=Nocardia alni TaxID=2815723 RepID=UPI001C230321|nr:type I-U CRISPR-associated protein Csx17 [Nocardia alni]
MGELALSGCRTTPLSGYLSALGVHRVVHRLLDPAVAGCWDSGVYVLHSSFDDVEDLTETLSTAFRPESVVSPWNSGSGFAGNGKSVSAEKILQWVRDSTDDRRSALRRAVSAADGVVAELRQRGADDPWDKKHKPDLLQLCRNNLPDAALAWLDAAVALGEDSPSYSRLLGTGGNLGRQDLSATYLQQARAVLEHRDSAAWLASALDGVPRALLPKDSPGQYDPGGVGMSDEPNSVGNPWTFLLAIEGTLLFATAMVRKFGAAYANAALPFQVAGSAAGFASAAAGERPLAELWTPQWPSPMQIPEVEHLFGEGRADWNSGAARSGLDMARAAATLGVDRGIAAFQRYVFVDRLGQNPIAVPAGQITVGVRGGVDLLAPLDRWRDAVRSTDPPAQVAARLRSLDQALFSHATSGSAAALAEVFAALGRCRAAADRSGTVRRSTSAARVPSGVKLLDHLKPALETDPELRIALALATSRDRKTTFVDWLRAPLEHSRLAADLADIARRRGFPQATLETVADRVPSVRGARIAFEYGLRLHAADVLAFILGAVDDTRIAALLEGLVCVDWRPVTGAPSLPGAPASDPTTDLLALFTDPGQLDYTDLDGQKRSLFVRPGHEWVARLTAHHTDRVLHDAARRLRIAGLRYVITSPASSFDGTRLAAALLMTPTLPDRRAALARVAVVGTPRITARQKETI